MEKTHPVEKGRYIMQKIGITERGDAGFVFRSTITIKAYSLS